MDTSMFIILSSKGIETFNRVMHIYDKGSSIVVNVGSIPSANHYQWIELLKAWFIFLFFGLLCFNSLNLWVRVIDPIQLFIYLSIHFNLQILNLFFTFRLVFFSSLCSLMAHFFIFSFWRTFYPPLVCASFFSLIKFLFL